MTHAVSSSPFTLKFSFDRALVRLVDISDYGFASPRLVSWALTSSTLVEKLLSLPGVLYACNFSRFSFSPTAEMTASKCDFPVP
jgi:hypothetical protein